MHQKSNQSEITVYMLFGTLKVKLAIEAPYLLISSGLHWEVIRLKKKGQEKAVKIHTLLFL